MLNSSSRYLPTRKTSPTAQVPRDSVSSQSRLVSWSAAALVLVVLAAAILTILLNHRLTDSPNIKDGYQNLKGAYNVAHHGILSLDEDDLRPSNHREPLPIFTLALYLRLHPQLSDLSLNAVNQGPPVITLKQHNLLWAFLCMLGVGLLVWSSVKERWFGTLAAISAVCLTYLFFLQHNEIVDRTYTEIEAAALAVWLSFCIIQALESGRWYWFFISGLLLGALSLTKASFLYVGVGMILVLLVVFGLWRPLWPRRQALMLFALLFSAMSLVVLPWMLRNFIEFGSFQITDRGGEVLMIRANYDGMNEDEYFGAFYHLTKSPLLKQLIGNYFGFSQKDLELGGRLQRLNRDPSASFAANDKAAEEAGNPERAVSFYRAARAEKTRLTNYYADQGAKSPRHRADQELASKALGVFLAQPNKHLKTSVLFMWAGIVGSSLIAAFIFPFVWVLALGGILRKNAIMIGLSLLPVGAFTFFSLASHFFPRLSAPLIPNLIAIITVLCAWILLWLTQQLRVRNRFRHPSCA
jgi:4-amino-4-deoxy-L-arabinose transferase-like glycosyltransferase